MLKRNGMFSLKERSYKKCHENYAHIRNRLSGEGGIKVQQMGQDLKARFTCPVGARKAGMLNKVEPPRNEFLCCR